MRLYPGTQQILIFFLSFSWELGNVLLSHNLVRGWRNSGISTNQDFSHVWLRTLSFTTPVMGGGGGSRVPLQGCTRGGGKEWRGESKLYLLFTCGIHSWFQEVLASPQLPVGALSRQVGRRSSFQAVSDSLGDVRGIYIIYINRL